MDTAVAAMDEGADSEQHLAESPEGGYCDNNRHRDNGEH